MAQRMDSFTFVDLRFLFGQIVDSLGVVDLNRIALGVREKIHRRAMLFPIGAQL